jgi:ERCC4-type nuclease
MNPDIEFVFDDREDKLHRTFIDECATRKSPNPTGIRCERLVLGDIIIYQKGVIWAVIERKRFDDLISSRFDGRLAEQTIRLRQWQTETGVWLIVIIEGMPDASGKSFRVASEPLTRYRLFLKTYIQCLCDLPVGAPHPDHCLVIRTRDMCETAATLHTLPRTLQGPSEHSVNAINLVTGPHRRSNGDPFVNQLCCTVGVSVTRAMRVRECFSNPSVLCDAWRRDTEGTRVLIAGLLGSKKVAERVEHDWTGNTPAPATAITRTRVSQSRYRNPISKSVEPVTKRRGRTTQHPSIDHSQSLGICTEDVRTHHESPDGTNQLECDTGR